MQDVPPPDPLLPICGQGLNIQAGIPAERDGSTREPGTGRTGVRAGSPGRSPQPLTGSGPRHARGTCVPRTAHLTPPHVAPGARPLPTGTGQHPLPKGLGLPGWTAKEKSCLPQLLHRGPTEQAQSQACTGMPRSHPSLPSPGGVPAPTARPICPSLRSVLGARPGVSCTAVHPLWPAGAQALVLTPIHIRPELGFFRGEFLCHWLRELMKSTA